MDRKVFVSYKYADTLVKDLGVYEKNIWGQMVRVETKVRHYVDKLQEKIGKDKYDREQSLLQDVLTNEAKAVRDAEIKATQNHIASLQAEINEIENQNKESALKAREEGKVTKDVQRKFKIYVQKRTKLQKTIEELNEHLSLIQSPDYLLIIEKRIIADRKKTASINNKKKKAEQKQSKQTKSKSKQ